MAFFFGLKYWESMEVWDLTNEPAGSKPHMQVSRITPRVDATDEFSFPELRFMHPTVPFEIRNLESIELR